MNPAQPPARVGLVRALGPFMATALVVGTVIGSGIFKKPQSVAEDLPYFGLVAAVWVLGGLLALLGALALAEVGVLFPRAGGNYVFLREGFGRLPGFLYGWQEFWISRSASLAALATFFTDALHRLLKLSGTSLVSEDYWLQRWLTVALIMGLALVNVLGVRWGGLLQLFITLVKVASLLAIMALPFGAASFAPSDVTPPAPEPAHFQPLWPVTADGFNLIKIGSALVAVLWAYHGWMNSVLVAEEIKRPQRNIPLSLLGGTLIIIFLYLGANVAYYLVISGPEIAHLGEKPVVTEFANRLLGPAGTAFASGIVMCSVFGALNGNLLVGPRVLFAMSGDGLAPNSLSAVHPRFRTPARAILVLAAWSSLMVLGAAALSRYPLSFLDAYGLNLREGKELFNVLTDYALFGAVIFETMAVATIFAFRRRLPDAERPYRCPGYPVVPALYVVILGLVLVSMFVEKRAEAFIGCSFIALGMLVFVGIEKKRTAHG